MYPAFEYYFGVHSCSKCNKHFILDAEKSFLEALIPFKELLVLVISSFIYNDH